jgi:hypothetical protein
MADVIAEASSRLFQSVGESLMCDTAGCRNSFRWAENSFGWGRNSSAENRSLTAAAHVGHYRFPAAGTQVDNLGCGNS